MNVKTQKGITLIALIITIIVLMILAVVVINSVNKTGIINYAHNAVTAYEKGEAEEENLIQGYMDYLNEYGNINGDGEGNEPDPVTLTGKYGRVTNDSDAEYIEFEMESLENGIERGNVKFMYWSDSDSNIYEDEKFYYRYEQQENIIVFESKENEYKEEGNFPWTFGAILDSNGKVVNKALYGYIEEKIWDGEDYNGTVINNYYDIRTTHGTDGFEKLSASTYEIIDNDSMKSVEFKSDGSLIISGDSGKMMIINDHFIIDGIVYIPFEGSELPGYYQEIFMIFNDSYVGMIAGS